MTKKQAGILGSIGDWVAKVAAILPMVEVLIRIFETNGTIKVGAAKKAAVKKGLQKILEIFKITGILKIAINLFADWAIDIIVDLKNKSGEFTHSNG